MVAADAGDSGGGCGWRGAAATAASEEGCMGTAVDCVLVSVSSTSVGFRWACMNRAFATRGWRGQGEVVVEGGGRGWLPLSLAALGCGDLEWLGTGTCCERATTAGCVGGRSPSLPRCCCCAGATMVVGLEVVRALAGGSGVGLRAAPDLFRQGRCGSSWEHATATTRIVLSGLVLIEAKAFTDVVSGDGGGTHWASLFPAGGTIARH
jgi:hypothetical protein